jgi:hypothetical protein
MTVNTALNTHKDVVEDLSRQVRRLERDANELRAAMLNLLADTANAPATPGDESIVC